MLLVCDVLNLCGLDEEDEEVSHALVLACGETARQMLQLASA